MVGDTLYFLQRKCRPKNQDFSDISLTATFVGDHPQRGVKVRHSILASENWTITWKRCKIGGKLLLISNRKSYELSIGTKISDLK